MIYPKGHNIKEGNHTTVLRIQVDDRIAILRQRPSDPLFGMPVATQPGHYTEIDDPDWEAVSQNKPGWGIHAESCDLPFMWLSVRL